MKRLKLASIGMAAALLASAAQAQNITLKIAHFLPAASNAQANVIEPWCEDLKNQSNGRIACQIYPSMQLGGTPATLADMARNGVADIVWTAPGYSAGKFPRLEVLELPFILPQGGKAGNALIWDFFEKHASEDFKPFKVLAVFGDGGMDFHTRGKPTQSMDDLKGLKLRASHRTAAKTLEALGATPVSMPPAQMTESISKGVVDGALAAWEVVPPTKLDEVTQFHTSIAEGQAALGYTVLAMLMNKRKYDSMPKELKEVLDRNSGKPLVERFGVAWDTFSDDAKAASPREDITAPDAAMMDAMQKATATVIHDWVQDASKRGIDAQKLLDEALQLRAH